MDSAAITPISSLTIEDIEVDFLDEEVLKAIRLSADRLLMQLVTDEFLRRSTWPLLKNLQEDHGVDKRPRLMLVPLDRLGALQGHGGGHVVIGYFFYPGANATSSRPMVIKTFQLPPKVADKLKDEYARAELISSYTHDNGHYFALPIHFDEAHEEGSYSVLWAPFTSNLWTFNPAKASRPSLKVHDLLQLIRDGEFGRIDDVISETFRVLMSLHQRSGKGCERSRSNLVDEYKDYLRGVEDTDYWAKTWRDVWTPGKNGKVRDFGRSFSDPFQILNRLQARPDASLCYGAIHGDLHPRNVVLTPKYAPRIIDFGWATEPGHIAKDFVLLECNLRFVAIRPNIPFKAMEDMARWVGFDDDPPDNKDEYCNNLTKSIVKLRQIAKKHFPEGTEWEVEYVLPLFLMALGLLKYLSGHDNQVAARLTVLSLAEYINQKILP